MKSVKTKSPIRRSSDRVGKSIFDLFWHFWFTLGGCNRVMVSSQGSWCCLDLSKLCPDQGSKFPSSVRLPPLSPFGRSNRLSTLFKLATVMQLTQNALWPGHTAPLWTALLCFAPLWVCTAALSAVCNALSFDAMYLNKETYFVSFSLLIETSILFTKSFTQFSKWWVIRLIFSTGSNMMRYKV